MATLRETNVAYVTVDPGSADKRPVKYASIAIVDTATTAVVAAVAGRKIRVLRYKLALTGNADETLTFKSGTTAKTGALPNPGVTTFIQDDHDRGLFETAESAALNFVITGTTKSANGYLVYVEV